MTRRLLICAFVLGITAAAPKSASPPARDSVIDRWLERQSTTHTWTADFTQTRRLKTLTQPLKTRGHLWFAAPNQFRWELGIPPQTIALRQTNQLTVIYPLLKRAERYPTTAKNSDPWNSALALLEAGFPQNRADLEAKFRVVRETRNGDEVELRLEPASAQARKLIPRMTLTLSAPELSLLATELEFPDGSSLRNDFTNPKLNPEIDPNVFQPELGADFKIVDPLKGR